MTQASSRNDFTLVHYLICFNFTCSLIKPFWLISFYVPGLGFLKAVPTVISIWIFALFFLSPEKKVVYKPIVVFCIASFLSIIFAQNTGISRLYLRPLVELLIGASATLTFFKTRKQINAIFSIFICSGFFLSLVGIVVGGVGIVPGHLHLNNEDAFGPFMCITFGMVFFLFSRQDNGRLKKLCFLTIITSFIGIVASYARGAFVSLIGLLLLIWYRHPKKIRFVVVASTLFLVILISAATLFKGDLYWSEMETIITEGKSEGTGGDRWILMGKACEIFMDHPLVGIGPRNYGYVLPRYFTTEYYHRAYGRVAHNIYFQILAEGGTLGILSFFLLTYYFFKNNAQIRRLTTNINISESTGANSNQQHLHLDKASSLSLALEAGMAAYLFNAFFYDLLYCSWFMDLIILNQLVYRNTLKQHSEFQAETSKTTQPIRSAVAPRHA